MISQIYNLTFT